MRAILIIGLALVWALPADAQTITRKYLSEAGQEMGFNFVDLRPAFNKRMDFDGDGNPELILFQDDDSGYTNGMRIINPMTREELYRLEQDEIEQNFGTGNLRALATFSVDEGHRGLFVLKLPGSESGLSKTDQFPLSIQGLVCDTLFFYSFRERISIGSLPARFSFSTGKTDDTTIEVIKNFAITDLDGDKRFDVVAQDSASGVIEVWGIDGSGTGVNNEKLIEQSLARLVHSYPNPFREEAAIEYVIEAAGRVELTLYDMLGRKVRTLVQKDQLAGRYHIPWDGRDAAGAPVAAGTYVYQLQVDGKPVSSRQMVRVR